jgi:predicted ABC-type transport system involved in lysophospholipase L1 biosynthesis ATPase subunit
MSGSSRAEARTTAQGLLEEVNVGHRTTHYPSELSGGERQRVALARALVNDPRLILADEPTGNLDEDHKKRVADLLFALAAERRKTLVLVTHDVHLADRAIHRFSLREGRLSHR